MCNIAGYIGPERAAPILLQAIEKQEGWGGGYYTGIVTIHHGTLHMRKVVGDAAVLRSETDAEDLPGTIGIVHSRSRSGGDRQWAHPFLSSDGRLAYVANGHQGTFADRKQADDIWQLLRQRGYTFASATEGPVGSYPQLSNGGCVHISDLMCGLIHHEANAASSILEGVRRAFTAFPAEIVGLVLSLDDPDAIVVGRINMPMMVARHERTVYLATTALAFPADVAGWIAPIPANAAVRVTAEETRAFPLLPPPAPVSNVLPWRESEDAILGVLDDGNAHPFGHLADAAAPFFDDCRLHPKAMLVYEVLRKLHSQQLVAFETHTVPGVEEGMDAPQRRVRRA